MQSDDVLWKIYLRTMYRLKRLPDVSLCNLLILSVLCVAGGLSMEFTILCGYARCSVPILFLRRSKGQIPIAFHMDFHRRLPIEASTASQVDNQRRPLLEAMTALRVEYQSTVKTLNVGALSVL